MSLCPPGPCSERFQKDLNPRGEGRREGGISVGREGVTVHKTSFR